MQRFERCIKDEAMVIVLDEIDQPSPKERNTILYNLCNLQKVGLVCICNSRSFLFSLDERIKSRLNPTQIEFSPYSADEIVLILSQKAEHALKSGVWNKKTIEKIAELAAGDARLAIKTLKNSAIYAEKAGEERIKHEHVQKGWNDANAIRYSYLLNKLTKDHHMLFETIKSRKEILSNKLWEIYLERCKKKEHKPIALRTYSEYVNKLRDMGLIRAERARVRGKVRVLKLPEG